MYNRLSDHLNLGTSGQVSQDEYNRATQQAELELLDILIPYYEINERVAIALSAATVVVPYANTSAGGTITYPSGVYYTVSAMYKNAGGDEFPTQKLRHMSLPSSMQNGLRKPDVAKDRVAWVMTDTAYQFYPKQTLNIQLTYIKKPTPASIILTPTVTADEDYVTPSIGADFSWHESVTNLLFYLILEKMGVQLKEQIQIEFAHFGIDRDMVKTTPNPVTE